MCIHAGDAAWLARYALSREGKRVPWELVEKSLRATHPYAVFAVRSMLSVPFFEKALYELPEVRIPAYIVILNMLLCKEIKSKGLVLLCESSPESPCNMGHLPLCSKLQPESTHA